MKYAQKSSAVRAARKQGLNEDTMVLVENRDGTWSFSSKTDADAALERVSRARGAKQAAKTAEAEDVRPRFLREKVTLSSPIAEQIAAAQTEQAPEIPDVVGFLASGADMAEKAATRSKRRNAIETAIAEAPAPAPKAPKAPKAPAERKTTDRPDGLRVGSKAALLVDLVTRPEGATYQELLDATGWGECRPRLKEACLKAGLSLELRKAETKGEPSRYFATK